MTRPAIAMALAGILLGIAGTLWVVTGKSASQDSKAVIVNGPAYTTTSSGPAAKLRKARTRKGQTSEEESPPAISPQEEALEKPLISEAFAHAAVRAIVIINNEPNSDRAKHALEDAEAEHDPTNVHEVVMYGQLVNFWLGSESKAMPECADYLNSMFRHRAYVPDAPDFCK